MTLNFHFDFHRRQSALAAMAFVAVGACGTAWGQTTPPTLALPVVPVLPGASGVPAGVIPSAVKPGPRLNTPEQKRDIANYGTEGPSERQVTPQVNIPLGKAPGPSPANARALRRGLPETTSGSINDAVASCEAEVDTASRTACLQRKGKK